MSNPMVDLMQSEFGSDPESIQYDAWLEKTAKRLGRPVTTGERDDIAFDLYSANFSAKEAADEIKHLAKQAA